MNRAAAGWLALALGCGGIDEPATEPAGEPARAEPRPLSMDPAPEASRVHAPAEEPRTEPSSADSPIEASCPFGYRKVVEDDGHAVCEPPAEPAAVARERFQEGMRMFENGEYEGALAAFLDVQALHPLPAVAYDVAMTLEHLGRHEDARRELRKLLDDPATPEHVRATAEDLLRRLSER